MPLRPVTIESDDGTMVRTHWTGWVESFTPTTGSKGEKLGVVHTTIYRWVQRFAPELEKRMRPHLKKSNDSWRVDETYVKVRGKWMYLNRAVDSQGQTLDFLLN